MKRHHIFAIIPLLLRCLLLIHAKAQSGLTSSGQTSDKYSDKLIAFEEFVRQQMEKNKIPGLTIGFFKDDYLWVKGFGFADVENNVPAKADSAYRLASVQKSMTAVAILQLNFAILLS